VDALLTRTDSRLQFCCSNSPLAAERNVIHNIALWFALALAQPALAQTAPTAAPNPLPANPLPAKPSATRPSATKPSPAKPSPAKPAAKKPEAAKPDAAAEHGPCIGVIPHIGESFAVQSIGLTVFGNDFKEVPIGSWGLDDLIVARVRDAAGPHFAVRRMAQPANAFEPYDHPPLFHDPDVQIKRVVQTIAGGSGCERYVVVVESGANWGDSNQGVRGIGIVHRGGIIDRFSVTYLFAVTYLYVFDGHTFELLKKGAGSLTNETLGERLLNDLVKPNPLHAPNRELEDFSWPPAPEAVTGLREPTRALLAASLDKVLPGLLAP
jgi:hypothetical protein